MCGFLAEIESLIRGIQSEAITDYSAAPVEFVARRQERRFFMTSYHANGSPMWNLGVAYHPNGQVAWSLGVAYHVNGQPAWNLGTAYWPNGKVAWNFGVGFWDNGRAAWNLGGGYHANGASMGTVDAVELPLAEGLRLVGGKSGARLFVYGRQVA